MLRHKSSLPAARPKEPVLATVPVRDVRAAIAIGGSYAIPHTARVRFGVKNRSVQGLFNKLRVVF